MAPTEYYDDPQAPEPNSLVVATSAVITDDQGRILLQRRTDSGNWALPGGAMEMNESLTDSVIRETKEETGLDIEVTGIVGTYTDPKHLIAYTDGEVPRLTRDSSPAARAPSPWACSTKPSGLPRPASGRPGAATFPWDDVHAELAAVRLTLSSGMTIR